MRTQTKTSLANKKMAISLTSDFTEEEQSACTDKLVKWIDDPHRAKAIAHFGEGVERQVAIRFETLFERLKTLNKHHGSTDLCCQSKSRTG